jgi:hypothetical protein
MYHQAILLNAHNQIIHYSVIEGNYHIGFFLFFSAVGQVHLHAPKYIE